MGETIENMEEKADKFTEEYLQMILDEAMND